MNMFKRSYYYLALIIGVWLSGAGPAVYAGDIQDANKLFKQSQHSQALDKVDGFLANNPKDAQARFLKGLIFTEQGKIAEAIKVFSGLTEDYPELPEPYNNLAVLYASQGEYDKAKQALEKAIRTHPSYATAHENLGDIYAKMASQAYDRALQLDRSNTATKTKLAMIQDLFAGGLRGKSSSAQGAAAPTIAALSDPALVKVEPVAPVKNIPAPVVKDVKPVPAINNSREILNAVNAWAAAWSARNVHDYLSFYAADFKTPQGKSREAWEAWRQDRLTKPKFIQVGITDAVVEFNDSDHATVKFSQSYRASHLTASDKKTLLMVKSGDDWLIQEERAH